MKIIGEDDAPLDENENPTGDVIALLYPDGNLVISGTRSIPATCTFENGSCVGVGGWVLNRNDQNDRFDLKNRISKITINEGLTTIPDNCFANLDFIEEINIPSTVTYIGAKIFVLGSESLANVIFSPSFAGTFHIECENNGVQYSDSFYECTWLTPYDSYVPGLCVTHKNINGIEHVFICYYE